MGVPCFPGAGARTDPTAGTPSAAHGLPGTQPRKGFPLQSKPYPSRWSASQTLSCPRVCHQRRGPIEGAWLDCLGRALSDALEAWDSKPYTRMGFEPGVSR